MVDEDLKKTCLEALLEEKTSQREVAAYCEVGLPKVREAIQELVLEGWIQIPKKGNPLKLAKLVGDVEKYIYDCNVPTTSNVDEEPFVPAQRPSKNEEKKQNIGGKIFPIFNDFLKVPAIKIRNQILGMVRFKLQRNFSVTYVSRINWSKFLGLDPEQLEVLLEKLCYDGWLEYDFNYQKGSTRSVCLTQQSIDYYYAFNGMNNHTTPQQNSKVCTLRFDSPVTIIVPVGTKIVTEQDSSGLCYKIGNFN